MKKIIVSLLVLVMVLTPLSVFSETDNIAEEHPDIKIFHQRNYDYYVDDKAQYTITAEITNNTQNNKENIDITLNIEDTVVLKDGDSFTQKLEGLKPQESKTVEWVVYVNFNGKSTLDYGVTAVVDNSIQIYQEKQINIGKSVDLSFFFDGKEISNNATYSDSYFEKNTEYNHELAWLSLCLELSSWTADTSKWGVGAKYNESNVIPNTDSLSQTRYKYIKNAYSAIGFDEMYFYNYDVTLNDASDKVAFSVAVKKDVCGATLIAVVIRGGVYGGEWKSNFDVGNGEYHSGFYNAAKAVYKKVIEDPDYSLTDGNIKFWVTGYSRGAAVANILSAMLCDESLKSDKFNKEDIFAYTFATPNGAKNVTNSLYDNIYNIINPGDIVPLVAPSQWGFSRYGTVKEFEPLTQNVFERVNQNCFKFGINNFDAKTNLEQKKLNDIILQTIVNTFSDENKSLKFQKVIGELLEFFYSENDKGEGISADEYLKNVLSKRYGSKYYIAYGSAKLAISLVKQIPNISFVDNDYLILFLTLAGIHDISVNEIVDILKSTAFDINKWKELYNINVSADDFASMLSGHLPYVYLAWMKQSEYNTFGTIKEAESTVTAVVNSNDITVCEHSFGEWVVIKDATENENGIKEKTCHCGYSVTEEIDKIKGEDSNKTLIIVTVSMGVIAFFGGITYIIIKKKK